MRKITRFFFVFRNCLNLKRYQFQVSNLGIEFECEKMYFDFLTFNILKKPTSNSVINLKNIYSSTGK